MRSTKLTGPRKTLVLSWSFAITCLEDFIVPTANLEVIILIGIATLVNWYVYDFLSAVPVLYMCV